MDPRDPNRPGPPDPGPPDPNRSQWLIWVLIAVVILLVVWAITGGVFDVGGGS